MSKLRKAYVEDFELIYPLLIQFESPDMDRSRWSLFFKKYWSSPEEHIGYIMIDNNVAVGFIGCVFSTRIINGRSFGFCGLSSWIIDKDHRSESILLFSEILRLKEYTITSFTSIPSAVEILKVLKFKVLDSFFYWIPKKFILLSFSKKLNYINDISLINSHLTGNELKIFEEHRQFNANHFVINDGSEYCYIIFKKNSVFKRKLISAKHIYYLNKLIKTFTGYSFLDKMTTIAKIHHISNIELFNRHLPEIVKRISAEYQVNGVLMDGRFYNTHKSIIKFRSMPLISLYRSKELTPIQIDSLYSEIFILDF